MREEDERRERCTFEVFLNASQAVVLFFLLLQLSEVRSSGFSPVWEDEEMKLS